MNNDVVLCYFPVISDRKVTKGTPLKGERAYDSVTERFGLET